MRITVRSDKECTRKLQLSLARDCDLYPARVYRLTNILGKEQPCAYNFKVLGFETNSLPVIVYSLVPGSDWTIVT